MGCRLTRVRHCAAQTTDSPVACPHCLLGAAALVNALATSGDGQALTDAPSSPFGHSLTRPSAALDDSDRVDGSGRAHHHRHHARGVVDVEGRGPMHRAAMLGHLTCLRALTAVARGRHGDDFDASAVGGSNRKWLGGATANGLAARIISNIGLNNSNIINTTL